MLPGDRRGLPPGHRACARQRRREMAQLQAGAAAVNITPEIGIAMGGYSARQGTATGVHDRLFARTVVFSDGSAHLVISVCDLVGIGAQIVSRVRELAESELGIP